MIPRPPCLVAILTIPEPRCRRSPVGLACGGCHPTWRIVPCRGVDHVVSPQRVLWPSEEGRVEAHLPAEQSPPLPQARLPQPHEHCRRSGRAEGAPGQGPSQAVGLIWRIRERSAFTRLAREGRRTRSGVLWCTYLFDPSASPPRVGFAIGRAVGPAVVRNRSRRRLRVILSALDLPAGWYLVGARPEAAGRSFAELSSDASAIASSVRRSQAAPKPVSNTSSSGRRSPSGS